VLALDGSAQGIDARIKALLDGLQLQAIRD
jgi:hypothetical protein